MNRIKAFLMITGILSLGVICLARAQSKPEKPNPSDTTIQKSDTTGVKAVINDIKDSRLSKSIVSSISKKQANNPSATVRAEDAFMPFEGKIIRRIIVHRVGFERSITDSTKTFRSTVARVANALHTDSREWLIRDNLFIKEDNAVNPYKVADNERYLRDLDFILDARFYILPTRSPDSVDIVVMTKDVFTIGGNFNPRSTTKTMFKAYDANLLGMGQRAQFTGLIEDGRTPAFGYEVLYRKNSIAGSFVTATAGYTQLNTGSSYGDEYEKAYFLKLERPLVSPYTRLAGGVEVSRNWSKNVYGLQDSVFRSYTYLINDFWIGYNIAGSDNFRDRARHFVSVRAFDQHFTRQPFQFAETKHPLYTNRSYVIGGVTFFKQDFYTARYIYGFGRTEDVPYGHAMSVYIGWSRQRGVERPYAGIDIGKSFVNRNGQFYNFTLRSGAYKQDGLEDAVVLLNGTVTSRLMTYKSLLIRQTFGGDYTHMFGRRTTLPLDINNELGIRGFATDSLWGERRFHISSETVVFTPLKLLGFRMAPFATAEMASLARRGENILKNVPYFGLGGGVRTRNENLVFGTVELRVMYYPRPAEQMSSFMLRVSSNLRVKYSASFVRPPSLVQYN